MPTNDDDPPSRRVYAPRTEPEPTEPPPPTEPRPSGERLPPPSSLPPDAALSIEGRYKPTIPPGAEYFDWAFTRLVDTANALRSSEKQIGKYQHDLFDEDGALARRFRALRDELQASRLEILGRLHEGAGVMTALMLMIGELEGKPPNGLRGKTILVVEDDPLVLKVVVKSLRGRGAIVHQASTVDEAVNIANSVIVDAMLVDLHLPPSGLATGVLLCEQLTFAQPGSAIVVMSGWPEPERLAHLPKIHLIDKPFALEELEEILHQAISSVISSQPPPPSERT